MRFWQLFIRSLKETYRDPLALGFLLAFPLMFMLLFGVAFGGDATPSYTIGIIDNDQTEVSQSFVAEALGSVPTLEITGFDDADTALEELKLGDLRDYIVLPDGFGEQVSQLWQGEEGDIALNITYDESDLLV